MRQHAEAIAREQDHVVWVLPDGRQLRIRDELERVGAARVLGDADVIVVDFAADRVVHDVLDDGAKADGAEDLGLGRLGERNALGIASALHVEDAGVGPHVFIVADKMTARVR